CKPKANHLCPFVPLAPHAQTTGAALSSPPHSRTQCPTVLSNLQSSSCPSASHHTSTSPSHSLLSPAYSNHWPSFPTSSSHTPTHSVHKPCRFSLSISRKHPSLLRLVRVH